MIDWFKPGIFLDSETKYEVDEVDTDPLAIPGEIKVEPGKHYLLNLFSW